MRDTLKPSILSAMILAFASLGDAFLYIVLPLHAIEMNVPLTWVGILLSVNRFIRIISNQLFARLFNLYGFRRITIYAAVFSVITTLLYGMANLIVVWIIARIIWGLCYSALRLSSIGYSLENKQPGIALGLNKGIQELGPVIALLAGPLLLKWTSVPDSFIIFSLVSILSLGLAYFLPDLKHHKIAHRFSFNMIPSSFNLVTFFSSVFVQGILIVLITKLLADDNLSTIELTTIAGLYLAFRRLCSVFLAPFGGMLADRWGINKVHLVTILFTIAGGILIIAGYTSAGILIAFSFYSIAQALSPGSAATGSTNHINAAATNSTWSDMGAATGVLIAGVMLDLVNPEFPVMISTLVLLLASIYYIKSTYSQSKDVYNAIEQNS